ncbi:hypothetical protein B296_00023718 [Ensete ventricosum]|uniref:Uncharacterized protein n=1 Tax=Ensete ventricosum TaxID=4639 RepID=A0A426XWT6_ENSVE|nr:hypothetical protein B296_00023718 [Ensete ventricosum]
MGWLAAVVATPPLGMAPFCEGGAYKHSARRSYRPRGSDACYKGRHSWVRRPPATHSTATYAATTVVAAG